MTFLRLRLRSSCQEFNMGWRVSSIGVVSYHWLSSAPWEQT